ncbi:MAG: hypothetical protein ACP5D7_20000 [Limnospira sp.]
MRNKSPQNWGFGGESDRGGYRFRINYEGAIAPPLSEEQITWIETLPIERERR